MGEGGGTGAPKATPTVVRSSDVRRIHVFGSNSAPHSTRNAAIAS